MTPEQAKHNRAEGLRRAFAEGRHKNKPHTPASKEKIRLANLGRSPSPETRAKLAAARKGQTMTPERREAHRLRMIRAHSEGKFSPSNVAKAHDAVRGKPAKGKNAKGPDNTSAKHWRIRSPSGVIYEGWNLNHIVRENAHLFNPADLNRNAAAGIAALFQGRANNCVSWKGWTAVLDGHPNRDPLDRKSLTEG